MTNKNDKYDGAKFSYLFDPMNPNRRVCIARRIIGNSIDFAFSVNNPPCYETITNDAGVEISRYLIKRGDVFNKQKARMIAHGRLLKCFYTIPKVEGEHPVRTIANFVCNHSFTKTGRYVENELFDRIIARVMLAELQYFAVQDAFKAEEDAWKAEQKAS